MAIHVNKYKKEFSEKLGLPIGFTSVELEGRFTNIRTRETNFTSFVADLVRTEWPKVDFAIINCGGFRSDSVIPPGDITLQDILSAFPEEEKICLMKLKVPVLHKALENAVSKYPSLEGTFPCVSGFRFALDPSKSAGSRIDINSLTDTVGNALDHEKEFTIAVNHSVRQGADGFTMIKDCTCLLESVDSKGTAEIVTNFLNRLAPATEIQIN